MHTYMIMKINNIFFIIKYSNKKKNKSKSI